MSLQEPLCRGPGGGVEEALEKGMAPPIVSASEAAWRAAVAARETARMVKMPSKGGTAGSWSFPPVWRLPGHATARAREMCSDVCWFSRKWFAATTDSAFIRSEVNGRQSRRIVLVAFLCTDIIGAILWADWCNKHENVEWNGFGRYGDRVDQRNACSSLGMNHFAWLAIVLPLEGAFLCLVGWDPWSFWSDCVLLPMWLVRLVIVDALLWNVTPETLFGDALWFSVLAVMCRVHSLALGLLMVSQVASLYCVIGIHGGLSYESFELVRYGHYGASMLLIVNFAYLLDEQSRLRSYSQLMSLQDKNAALAESLLNWKMLADNGNFADGARVSNIWPFSGWQHRVLEGPEGSVDRRSGSSRSWSQAPSSQREGPEPLPLPGVSALPRFAGVNASQPTRRQQRPCYSRSPPKAVVNDKALPDQQASAAGAPATAYDARRAGKPDPHPCLEQWKGSASSQFAPTSRPFFPGSERVGRSPWPNAGGSVRKARRSFEEPMDLLDVVE